MRHTGSYRTASGSSQECRGTREEDGRTGYRRQRASNKRVKRHCVKECEICRLSRKHAEVYARATEPREAEQERETRRMDTGSTRRRGKDCPGGERTHDRSARTLADPVDRGQARAHCSETEAEAEAETSMLTVEPPYKTRRKEDCTRR